MSSGYLYTWEGLLLVADRPDETAYWNNLADDVLLDILEILGGAPEPSAPAKDIGRGTAAGA